MAAGTLSAAGECLRRDGMDKHEAQRILARRIEELRMEPHDLLRSHWLGQPDCEQVVADSGVEYQIEIEASWDDQAAGHLRLVASIDDGGWRALAPITDGFVVAPDGSFIGE
jgi:hypothetical protein